MRQLCDLRRLTVLFNSRKFYSISCPRDLKVEAVRIASADGPFPTSWAVYLFKATDFALQTEYIPASTPLQSPFN